MLTAQVLVLVVAVLANAISEGSWQGPSWTMYGGNYNNDKNAEWTPINKHNVGSLDVAWVANYTSGTDIGGSATPTIKNGFIYSTDWGGHVTCRNLEDGSLVWDRVVNDFLNFTGNPSDVCARNAPVIYERSDGSEVVIISAPSRRALFDSGATPVYYGPLKVIALDSLTGSTVWVTVVEENQWSIGTNSMIVYKDRVLGGVSSFENVPGFFSGISPYTILPDVPFSSRGSVFSLDVDTGEMVWKTYMLPEGLAGAGVWGSSFSVDTDEDTLFAGTGQLYNYTEDMSQCLLAHPNMTTQGIFDCYESEAAGKGYHFDSMVKLDFHTGEILWAENGGRYLDAWTYGCTLGKVHLDNTYLPLVCGPDGDYGSAPVLYEYGPGSGNDDDDDDHHGHDDDDDHHGHDDDDDHGHHKRKRHFGHGKGKGNGKGNGKTKYVAAHEKTGLFTVRKASNGEAVANRVLTASSHFGGGQWAVGFDKSVNRLLATNTGQSEVQTAGNPGMTYELADGSVICDGSWWSLHPTTLDVIWQQRGAYARDGSECPPIVQQYIHTNVALVGPQTPASQTAFVAQPPPVNTGPPKVNEVAEFSKSHGVGVFFNGMVAVPDMTGTIYILDSTDGEHLKSVRCEKGGIYGGISVAGNRLCVLCGYGRLIWDEETTGSNQLMCFEAKDL